MVSYLTSCCQLFCLGKEPDSVETISTLQLLAPPYQPPAINRPALSSEDQRIYDEFRLKIGRTIPQIHTNIEPITIPVDCKSILMDLHKVTLHNNHYIASAGWMDRDPALFWKVVDLNRPGLIVKLKDNGAYWPNEVGESLPASDAAMPKVTCISKEQINESLTKRVLEVAGQSGTFQITHLDFKGWPDFGTPSTERFQQLMAVAGVECSETSPEKRIFVQCGGGMGRTGTFIAAHAALHTPIEHRTTDLFYNLIMEMRSQRPRPMVETPEQYLFLHKILGQRSTTQKIS